MKEASDPIPVYMFVIWHRGMPEVETVLAALRGRFTVLKQFDVTWSARDYIANFAAFYGWKSYSMWLGKKRRSGTGPFRVVMVWDENPAGCVENSKLWYNYGHERSR